MISRPTECWLAISDGVPRLITNLSKPYEIISGPYPMRANKSGSWVAPGWVVAIKRKYCEDHGFGKENKGVKKAVVRDASTQPKVKRVKAVFYDPRA